MKVIRSDQFPFLLLVILTLAGILIFWTIMDMILLGASLAIVLIQLHRRFAIRTSPVLSASLITLMTLGACSALAFLTFIFFSSNATILSTLFSTIGTWLEDPSTNLLIYGIPLGKGSFSALLQKGSALFINYPQTIVDNLTLILFKIFTFFFTLFILLLHGDELRLRILEHISPSMNEYVTCLSEAIVDTLYSIYVVQVAIAVLTFVIALPVFYLLGYGNILFYSFFAGFCELIPILGSSLVFVILGAYALAIGDMHGVLILFILGYIGVALMPEIWVRPVLVGRRVKIHPVIMFIGIIGGLLAMGLAGFVLGPVIIVLIITTYRIYIREGKGQVIPDFFKRNNQNS